MDISAKLKKIDRLKKKLDAFSIGKDWDDNFIEKIKIDFTYNSNKIEGNALTYGQTIQLLKEFVAPKNTSTGDCLDILNHQQVLDEVFGQYQATEITEANIKRLHKVLMQSPDQWSDSIHYDPGKYKILENVTTRSSGKIHYYIQPNDVPAAISELIKKTNHRLSALVLNATDDHILKIVTEFHFQFLNTIHPFGDGNGRIARIIMNIILLKSKYPPIFIKSINKLDYMNSFEAEENSPGSMISFMADRLIESLKVKEKFLKDS
ncbi:Fic family protein [Pedobacter sp. W3I1]|uniref:Fic family protein n=1 Tax=Pedobacter sp. W3I1 TaxID=3042291 RepID=UPI00277F74D7|nr:Fic family protein [Pedobacter sp. W3I1]MDQ0640843.1 Fic family protein [Pedobacter sp. W3I1]